MRETLPGQLCQFCFMSDSGLIGLLKYGNVDSTVDSEIRDKPSNANAWAANNIKPGLVAHNVYVMTGEITCCQSKIAVTYVSRLPQTHI
jgi:hypothetical protein